VKAGYTVCRVIDCVTSLLEKRVHHLSYIAMILNQQ